MPIKMLKFLQTSFQYTIRNRRLYSILTRESDTIYALSTGFGSAVSIIRISGSNAKEVFKMFSKKEVKPRIATLTKIHHPKTKQLLDYGLVLYFPEPNSYTGEDVIELHVHGGRAVVFDVLDALSHLSGFRPAGQGDFTRRAFSNGKMDLTQVEALSDLINAETTLQKQQALQQLSGSFSESIQKWNHEINHCLSHVTAYIDFGDEEHIEEDVYQKVIPRLKKVEEEITKVLNDERKGERIRDGFKITLVGEPNAGKSSLLNVLAQKDVAIVSDIAGTTRDVISVRLNLNGYPVTISDTCGIRETDNPIEQEGVRRAQKSIIDSDIIIHILDSSNPDNTTDLLKDTLKTIHPNKILTVYNKKDLCTTEKDGIHISCKTKEGIDNLVDRITKIVHQNLNMNEDEKVSITRQRHRHCLQECVKSLQKFHEYKTNVDIASEYLREASWWLGEIVGQTDVEELLDVIFKEFCIGK